MSAEDTHLDLIRALTLAWELEVGISWHDVSNVKEELNALRFKYNVDPYDIPEETLQDSEVSTQ